MPFVDPVTKCAVEKKRREIITAKIGTLKGLVYPNENQDIPHHQILAKAAEILTGTYPIATTPSPLTGTSQPSTTAVPIKKDRKTYKKELEAVRRSKEAAALEALHDFVISRNPGQSAKIGKIQLLDIIIEALQNRGTAAAITAPATPPLPFSMQRFLTVPLAPLISPLLPAPIPLVPVMQGAIGFANYLFFYQQFAQFFPMVPIAKDFQRNEDEEEEIIDVVNI